MLLSLKKITKDFPVQKGLMGRPTAFVKAVDDISLDLEEGEIVGLVGESGCGKTTLGRCAVGLYEPTRGDIFWDSAPIKGMLSSQKRSLRRNYQMVFQNPYSSLNPRQRIGEILQEPLEVHGLLKPPERSVFVRELLELVGLSGNDLNKYPHEFSGGQRQRIGLARALVCHPKLVVLDEPLSSLDVSVQASILNLLSKLNQKNKFAYLFISHDLQVVGYLSLRLLVMYLGRVIEESQTSKIIGKPRHPYTRILLEASEGREIKIEGEPPNPAQAPSGCAFHPRCAFAEDRCRRERQVLLDDGNGWKTACWKWKEL